MAAAQAEIDCIYYVNHMSHIGLWCNIAAIDSVGLTVEKIEYGMAVSLEWSSSHSQNLFLNLNLKDLTWYCHDPLLASGVKTAPWQLYLFLMVWF